MKHPKIQLNLSQQKEKKKTYSVEEICSGCKGQFWPACSVPTTTCIYPTLKERKNLDNLLAKKIFV